MNKPTSGSFRSRARLSDRKSVARRAALRVRDMLLRLRLRYLCDWLGMDLSRDCRISLKANLDRTNPRGVHVAEGTYIAFGAVILAHDMSRATTTDTYVGRCCFIGAHAIIMPGVRIGDQCIVGSGSVVTRDVPPNTIVGGNPARVLRTDIRTRRWGVLEEHYEAASEAALKQGRQVLRD